MVLKKEANKTEVAKSALATIAPYAATVLTTIVTTYGVLYSSVLKSYTDHINNQTAEIRTLQKELNTLRQQVFEMQAQLLSKDLELAKKYDNHTELFGLIENAPTSAWFLKVIDLNGELRFPIEFINSEYSFSHSVSKEKARGLEAKDVWPAEFAKQFTQHNTEVYRTKRGKCFIEEMPSFTDAPIGNLNKIRKYTVCRWPIPYENGYGIAAASIKHYMIKEIEE